MLPSQLKSSNPWWEHKNNINSDFHLSQLKEQKITYSYELIPSFDQGIYSIRGPRQVGKTTWIKQKIKQLLEHTSPLSICFYSCDNLKDYKELETLLDTYFKLSDSNEFRYIFLDEIPYVSEWQRCIKHLYDLGQFKNCCVILSGSHSIDISRSIERLPGRGNAGKRHFIMTPLSFSQYLDAIEKKVKLSKNMKKSLAQLEINTDELLHHYRNYLLTGGFLKAINEFHNNNTISDTTYDIYIKWIIGDLAKWNLKERSAKQILNRIIQTYTSEISWNALTSGTDIGSHHTTSKYVDALEDMFVVKTIYKMNFNKKRADYPKSKKIYITDPFLYAAILKWTNSGINHFSSMENIIDTSIDKLSEGVVFNHIAHLLYNKAQSDIFHYSDIIFYWTNKSKTKEVDFVIENTGIEVKYSETIKASDYKGVAQFKKQLLLSKKDFAKNTMPVTAFLLLLDDFSSQLF